MNETLKRRMKALLLLAGLFVVGTLVAAVSLHLHGRSVLGRVATEFERELGPLDPRAHEREELARGDNATTWLLAGAEAVDWTQEAKGLVGRTGRGVPLEAWSPEDRAAMEAFRRDNRRALELLHRAIPLERSSYGLDLMAEDDADLDVLVGQVRAARFLKADARLALAEGDPARALRDAATIARLAAALQREPSLIHVLIGTASEHVQLSLVREVVESGTRDAALLRELEGQLLTTDPAETVRRLLAAEGARAAAVLRGEIPTDEPVERALRAVGDLPEAEVLDLQLALHRVSGRPLPELLDLAPSITPSVWSPWGRRVVAVAAPNWVNGIARMRGVAALRELARTAVEARIARLTDPSRDDLPARAAEAFQGLELEAEAGDDGSLVLRLEGASDLFARVARFDAGEIADVWRVR